MQMGLFVSEDSIKYIKHSVSQQTKWSSDRILALLISVCALLTQALSTCAYFMNYPRSQEERGIVLYRFHIKYT